MGVGASAVDSSKVGGGANLLTCCSGGGCAYMGTRSAKGRCGMQLAALMWVQGRVQAVILLHVYGPNLAVVSVALSSTLSLHENKG